MSQNLVSSIQQAIAKLRRLVKVEVQNTWRDFKASAVNYKMSEIDLQMYPLAPVNQNQYIVFPKGKQIQWLAQRVIIPSTVQGYPISGLCLRLVLTWWAEDAQTFIDGKLVQQGDLFDSSARVVVTTDAQPGQEYLIVMRLVSPGHDIGALMRSHLVYEHSDQLNNIDPGLVADELTVLLQYLSEFEPEYLDQLAIEISQFNLNNLSNADKFEQDLAELRSRLLPLAHNIRQRRFNLLGHAHLDMAWLWTTEETYEVAERTFKSVLDLQQDFPALTFGHTSPALYQWLEINRPDLFKKIQDAVGLNKWELLGGMWIEPETNLVSGESLIRQLLYGQRYYQEKFGKISTVGWLPDSFGFTWQLPQIASQCGIEYFVTGKLHWNDTTQFPHGCFWWESPDGTQLLTLMSPPNVTGVMDTNPLTMTNYAVDWELQTGLQEVFWLPGVGDHGGGPTRDMLEVAQKWQRSPFFPQLEFTTAVDYLDKIAEQPNITKPQDMMPAESDHPYPLFPVWQDELYLELHRGYYTVHAEQKQYNRRCERLLYQAELWSTFATLLCGDKFVSQTQFSNISRIIEKEGLCQADWQQLIETAWKKVLFNQFHDILPGTSIPEVFTEANQTWEEAIAIGDFLLASAVQAIATSIKLPEPPQADAFPLVVFNSLNWQRSRVITLENEQFGQGSFRLWDHHGQLISSEVKQVGNQLSFLAPEVPGVGYRLYWLCQQPATEKIDKLDQVTVKSDPVYQLENQYLKVTVNPHTGDLTSIFDKQNNREVLRDAGNKLQAFEDRGQYWDAWNIAPDYEQKQLPDTELESIAWIEAGLGTGIRVVKLLNRSHFRQDYILEGDSPLLKIKNCVDWQETHVLVKVSFPFNLTSDRVTYEIPCGIIDRPTQPQTAAAKAKWEVAALNWADITDHQANYGVSLLNDCKYGYDATHDQLRLTLLRSPEWPDPQSDQGLHHFTYGIYPHQGSWQEANTVQYGYELNTPLPFVLLERQQHQGSVNYLSPSSELLNLSAKNLVLMALKFSTEQNLVLRCYESQGRAASFNINSDINLEIDSDLDCLERSKNIEKREINSIQAYKITTFQLKQVIDND
ncbi:MAG: alpha-mannosidase [Cyanobacteria bacterium P01_E01_bin.35]